MFFSMPPPIFTSGSIREKKIFFSEPLFPEGERKKKKNDNETGTFPATGESHSDFHFKHVRHKVELREE